MFNAGATVREIRSCGDRIYELRLESAEIAREAGPGQFVHICCRTESLPERSDPLLRRPFSFNRIETRPGCFALKFTVRGKGTSALSRLKSGDKIQVLGPLGRGFTVPAEMEKPLLIGGGMGAAPLPPLLEELPAEAEPHVLLGAKSEKSLLDYNYFREKEEQKDLKKLITVTEDGSCGEKGMISDLLPACRGEIDYVFACGPEDMLKEIKSWSGENDIRGQASLEARMACGVGACMSCVKKIKSDRNEPDFGTVSADYKKVCSDGPVFPLEEVVFDG